MTSRHASMHLWTSSCAVYETIPRSRHKTSPNALSRYLGVPPLSRANISTSILDKQQKLASQVGQYSTAEYSHLKSNIAQYNPLQPSTAEHSQAEPSTIHYSQYSLAKAQPSSTHYSQVVPSIAQKSPLQTTEYSPLQPSILMLLNIYYFRLSA